MNIGVDIVYIPRISKLDGNEIFIKKGKRAVILLHGFCGNTKNIAQLTLMLANKGFTVIAPLYKGHNASFEELEKTSVDDYMQNVIDAYEKVKKYASVDVVGFSAGGVFALKLARIKKIRRVVTLAPGIFPDHKLIRFLGIIRFFIKKVRWRKTRLPGTNYYSHVDLYNPKALKHIKSYLYFPLDPLYSICQFTNNFLKEIPKIKNPILIIHSVNDSTVKPSGSQYIYDNVGSTIKKLVWLHKCGHVITMDFEADVVNENVLEFLK